MKELAYGPGGLEATVLEFLIQNPGRKPGEITAAVGSLNTSVSRVLRRLREQDRVQRDRYGRYYLAVEARADV